MLNRLFGRPEPTPFDGRSPVKWGEYTIPPEMTPYHFMSCGATGSGKSTIQRILLWSILPDVKTKDFDTRVILFDPATEAYTDVAKFGLQDTTAITNPFDRRCLAWDVAEDLLDQADAENLSKVMIPPVESPNRFFYDASRKLLEVAAHSFIKLKRDEGHEWTFRDLVLACFNVEDLRFLSVKAGVSAVSQLKDFYSGEREGPAVRSTLTVENSKYGLIAAAWDRAFKAGRKFSFKKWVAGDGPQVVLLGLHEKALHAQATLNRVFIEFARQYHFSHREANAKTGRRTWVFMDEFTAIGYMETLVRLFKEGRKYGMCCVLGFQHIDDIEKMYPGLSAVLVDQCYHQAFFHTHEPKMGKWCAEHFGRNISYREENKYGMAKRYISRNDPRKTENDFIRLRPGSYRTGFECFVRGPEDSIPGGYSFVAVPPHTKMIEWDRRHWNNQDERYARFLDWKTPLELQPWSVEERTKWGLPEVQVDAPGIGFPHNLLPDDITPRSEFH